MEDKQERVQWEKYLWVFIVTAVIFVAAFYVSSRFSSRKIDQLREVQDRISADVLSAETRFALLGAASCEHIEINPDFENDLNEELNNLARRVKFVESQFGPSNDIVTTIKKQYALLQIKDYILSQEINQRCQREVPTFLYFHAATCGNDCVKQSLVLDEIHQRYPGIRIYWLEGDLPTPAMEALVSIFGVEEWPSIATEKGHLVSGFQTVDDLEKLVPIDMVEMYHEKQKTTAQEPSAQEMENSQTPSTSQ